MKEEEQSIVGGESACSFFVQIRIVNYNIPDLIGYDIFLHSLQCFLMLLFFLLSVLLYHLLIINLFSLIITIGIGFILINDFLFRKSLIHNLAQKVGSKTSRCVIAVVQVLNQGTVTFFTFLIK